MNIDTASFPIRCPICEQRMRRESVKTAIWHKERLFVVEDIPAYVCDTCVDQYYDPEATDILRKLTENGFSQTEAKREILVPVFSLAGKVPVERKLVLEEEEVY